MQPVYQKSYRRKWYNFKATVTNETADRHLTFFRPAGDEVTSHSRSETAKKYKGISSSTRKGSADFSVEAILDKPAMIEGASSSKEDTQGELTEFLVGELKLQASWDNRLSVSCLQELNLSLQERLNHSVRRFSVNEVIEPKKQWVQRFVYEDNLIHRRSPKTKKALITTPSNSPISTAFFSNNIVQDFQENFDDEEDVRTSEEYLKDLDLDSQNEPKIKKDYKTEYKKMKGKLALLEASPSTSQSSKTFQSKNKCLIVETFDWDEEEVSDDENMAQVKVLMALADDELSMGKNNARNGEWIGITMRKVNILLSIDGDADWQTFLKYINIDLKFVEE
ncbi:hypothetical protein Tco_1474046 [Tanacetum coccineum]